MDGLPQVPDGKFQPPFEMNCVEKEVKKRVEAAFPGRNLIVFQCTQHTLGLEPEQWRVLDQAHRKRNLAEYEGDMDVDDQFLEALIRVADTIAGKLQDQD